MRLSSADIHVAATDLDFLIMRPGDLLDDPAPALTTLSHRPWPA